MRDSTKVIIGFGCIWGLISLGVLLLGSFAVGANDSLPEIVAILLYGLTALPSCILAIWFPKPAAMWLLALSVITGCGFIYQVFRQATVIAFHHSLPRDVTACLAVALIPALIGALLLRSQRAPLGI